MHLRPAASMGSKYLYTAALPNIYAIHNSSTILPKYSSLELTCP